MKHGISLWRVTTTAAVTLAVTLGGAGSSFAGQSTVSSAAGTELKVATPTTPAAASPQDQPVSGRSPLTPAVSSRLTGRTAAATQAALASYWTPARMKAARPATQLPALSAALAKAQRSGALAKAARPKTSVPGKAAPATTATAKVGTGKPAALSTATQKTAWRPNLPVGSPVARTSGKVFFTSGGANYVCSGTVVNTEGKSTVWTAGHCLADGGRWHHNWVFVPNYVNGSAPYGYWTSRQPWTTSGWFYNRDFNNDVGAAIVNRNWGYRITDYLGGQGIAWNQSQQYVCAFGYPAASPFNGQYLYEECGQTAAWNGAQYLLNDMTGGSSGGAWLAWFNGSWGWINGHNDWKYSAWPHLMFSPYYGNQVANLYSAVRYISA